MKKNIVFVTILSFFVLNIASAQRKRLQEKASFGPAIIYDFPISDSLYIIDTLRALPAYTYEKTPVFVLATPSQYSIIKSMFFDSLGNLIVTGNGLIKGHGFIVSYLPRISAREKGDLKKVDSTRRTLFADLNEYAKSTILSFMTDPVYARRDEHGIPTPLTPTELSNLFSTKAQPSMQKKKEEKQKIILSFD